MPGTYVYSDIGEMPSRSATARIVTASRPSASAIAIAASTTSSTLCRGRGPRRGASVSRHSSVKRACQIHNSVQCTE